MWVLSNIKRAGYERLLVNVENGGEIALVNQGHLFRIIRYQEPGHVRHELDGQQIGEYTTREAANQFFDSLTQQLKALDATADKPGEEAESHQ